MLSPGQPDADLIDDTQLAQLALNGSRMLVDGALPQEVTAYEILSQLKESRAIRLHQLVRSDTEYGELALAGSTLYVAPESLETLLPAEEEDFFARAQRTRLAIELYLRNRSDEYFETRDEWLIKVRQALAPFASIDPDDEHEIAMYRVHSILTEEANVVRRKGIISAHQLLIENAAARVAASATYENMEHWESLYFDAIRERFPIYSEYKKHIERLTHAGEEARELRTSVFTRIGQVLREEMRAHPSSYISSWLGDLSRCSRNATRHTNIASRLTEIETELDLIAIYGKK